MSIDLTKQWPAVLDYIDGIKPDGSNTAIPDWYNSTVIKRAPLRARLNLGDNVRAEEEVQADVSKLSNTTKFLVGIYNKSAGSVITAEQVINNKLADGSKFSKAFTKLLHQGKMDGALLKILAGTQSSVLSELHTELPKLKSIDKITQCDNPVYPFIEMVVQNFYSELSALQQSVYGFSTDPLDIMTAAGSTCFTSCFTPGKFNSRGPMCIATSAHTGVIYSKKGTTVTGRAWVLFDESFAKFCVMKTYGFMDESIVESVCAWLCNMLNSDINNWRYVSGSGLAIAILGKPAGWYVDPVTKVYFIKDGLNVKHSIRIADAEDAPCIICGKVHTESTVVCDECLSTRVAKCSSCSKRILVDKMDSRLSEQYICSNCASSSVVCPDCGTTHLKDKACACIFWNKTCAVCGDTVDKFSMVGKYAVCDKCAEALLGTTCEVCGRELNSEHITENTAVHGHAMCTMCAVSFLAADEAGKILYTATYAKNKSSLVSFVEAHPELGYTLSDKDPSRGDINTWTTQNDTRGNGTYLKVGDNDNSGDNDEDDEYDDDDDE